MTSPLVLESQGFYNRQVVTTRMAIFWPLTRSCVIVTMGLVLLLFLFREEAPRGVAVLFAMISFALVWVKEEMLHHSSAQPHGQGPIPSPCHPCRHSLRNQPGSGASFISATATRLKSWQNSTSPIRPWASSIELLHEHSAGGVLVSAKHAHFEHVENILRVCEVEGVEAYLVADFFATQIARASFDELLGHPLIVFRTTPEASWEMMLKLMVDFFGALAAAAFHRVVAVSVDCPRRSS